MSRIEIRMADITRVGTDAVVNAANSGLWMGGGVCGAIFRAAGEQQLTDACEAIGHCDTGSAVITPGFAMSKYIIHAVGPRWDHDEEQVKHQLYSCYRAALKLARENGCASVGFPLISAGIFGVPVEIAWEQAIKACLQEADDLQIVFAVRDEAVLEAGKRILGESAKPQETENASMIIFHDVDKEYGFMSNWYLSDFYLEGRRFTSAEQFLMFSKAMLFGDQAHADAIMKTDDPETIKAYGRAVTPFDGSVWRGHLNIILYRAVLAKFSQNTDLRRQLLATGDAILAEGTYGDVIYANGVSRNSPDRFDLSKWRGMNLLGFALMEVRRELRQG